MLDINQQHETSITIVLYCIICLFRKHSPYKSLQNIDII